MWYLINNSRFSITSKKNLSKLKEQSFFFLKGANLSNKGHTRGLIVLFIPFNDQYIVKKSKKELYFV